jgi:hypothetical protein
MKFASPLLTEAMQQKNRRTVRILFLVMIGLFVFSVLYIIVAN